MKLRHLFMINLIFAAFFGVSCSLFPRWVFQLYGLAYNDGGIWATRLVGGSILGFATLMWFGRKTAYVETRKAIALALFVQDAIGFAASIEIQLTGSVNTFGWFSLALYGLLAFAYVFFLFVRPQDS